MVEVQRASGRIGARVTADLDHLLTNDDAQAAVRQALWDHQVLVFPGAHPTEEQHIALAEVFGEPTGPEGQNVTLPGDDRITVFDSAGGYKADMWHCDATFRADPPQGAVLCMRTMPSVGGDTMWTNCYAAYDALSGGMKKLLDNRRAKHDIAADVGTEHPVVIAHPITGRPVLFVNKIFTRAISNLPPEESAAILPFLLQHLTRPEFSYRHQWSEGDVVVWDNWSTQHYALFDYDEQRVVHRVNLAGRELAAAPLT